MINPRSAKSVLGNLEQFLLQDQINNTPHVINPAIEARYTGVPITGGVTVTVEKMIDCDNPVILDSSKTYTFPDITGTLSEVVGAMGHMWEWPELGFISKNEDEFHVKSIDFHLEKKSPSVDIVLWRCDIDVGDNAEIAGDSWNDWYIDEHLDNLCGGDIKEVDAPPEAIEYRIQQVDDSRNPLFHHAVAMPHVAFHDAKGIEKGILEKNSYDESVALFISNLHLPEITHCAVSTQVYSTLYYGKN